MKKLLSICLKGFLVLIASMFLMQGVAQAHLYGVSYGVSEVQLNNGVLSVCSLSRLYVIDPNTGLRTGVGDIIGESNSDNVVGYWGVPGIDFHPVTGELYGIGFRCSDPNMENPYLLTLDPCTGYVSNEQCIGIGDLEDTFQRFTDISFKSDGTLYAFYLFDPNVEPTSKGAVATIDLDNGDAEAVGETGNDEIAGGGIAFLYGDPNNGTLWQAESSFPGPLLEAELNELDPDDGDIEDSNDLEFHSPIADGDFPTVNAMDSQPGTGMLYAAISFYPLTKDVGTTPERWICGNYLATVDEGTGDVKVIGCLSGEFGGFGSLYTEIYNIKAIAFAPLPVADAGWDFSVEQSSWDGATVCLDGMGSFDYIACCGDPLLYIWSWLDANTTDYLYGKTPCVVLPLGTHEINLTVDNCNGTDDDTVFVTVEDTIKPIITCLPDIVVEQTSHAGALVDPNDPAVFDLCDPNVTVEGIADPNHPLPYIFPLGTSTITWTATDRAGNTAVCTQNVTVVDRTDPVITSVTTDPTTIPPGMCGSGPLHEVTVQVDATDICDSAPTCKIISVSSNQTGSRYSFFKEPDWFITGANTVLLRGKNDLFSMENRIYTITVECTDDSGNSSTAYTTVEVKYSWSWDPILDPNSWSTDRVRRLPNRDRRLPRRSRR